MITEIVSPSKIIFSESIDFIILPGEEGDLGIFDKHTPTITNLRTGLIYIYKDNSLFKIFLISKGVCEITEEKCTILTEEAENTKDTKIEDMKKLLSENKENKIVGQKIKALENKYYS
ncbi:MAG: ATP synthase F1 subunit epsilon [Rickettsiales bacterium]|nr:ATP synthase F1 subunit epsilon [Rickettsiales bacterium]|tara:strand:- start:13 stop:366 length:354 start_codon:yes stop_codon:yes gene_type:complete